MGNQTTKLGVLFSGGKDSALAMYLAVKKGHEAACLITVESENPESYMFHTPSIRMVEPQAEQMGIPVLMQKTKGVKEEELQDLRSVLMLAKQKYKIDGVVTGAVASEYQGARIKQICDGLGLECLNPLWKMDEIELLEALLKHKFEVVITGVFAYPLTKDWLGRKIDLQFIEEAKELWRKYQIHPAGEGGEFETYVLNCPMFKRRLKIVDEKALGEGHSFRLEIKVE